MDYNSIADIVRMTVRETLSCLSLNLDNGICSCSEKENIAMAKRIKVKATIGNEEVWITGDTQQALFDRYIALCIDKGVMSNPEAATPRAKAPLIPDYVRKFYDTFKADQQSLTIVNRNRIIANHIADRFSKTHVDELSVTDIQKWFDVLAETYTRETIVKIKNTISPAMDAAVEDGFIDKNPFKSNRLTIRGKESTHHKAIPHELMENVRKGIPVLAPRERLLCGLLSYTGMRMEECLGLKWEDVDDNWIQITRAVIHPSRNKPEVKPPKTKASTRTIPMPKELLPILAPLRSSGFILFNGSSNEPLTYTQARASMNKIRKSFSITEYSAHDFRDTCATEWREAGMSLDLIARMLGHSKSDVTEKRYVNYRKELLDEARCIIDHNYTQESIAG